MTDWSSPAVQAAQSGELTLAFTLVVPGTNEIPEAFVKLVHAFVGIYLYAQAY